MWEGIIILSWGKRDYLRKTSGRIRKKVFLTSKRCVYSFHLLVYLLLNLEIIICQMKIIVHVCGNERKEENIQYNSLKACTPW